MLEPIGDQTEYPERLIGGHPFFLLLSKLAQARAATMITGEVCVATFLEVIHGLDAQLDSSLSAMLEDLKLV